MTGNDNNAAGTWICNCGKENTGKFCVKCGSPRPVAPAPQNPVSTSAEWVCSCGKANTSKFCVKCGAPRPAEEAIARQVAEARAAQEAAARRAAEEEAARQAAEARAAQEAAARRAAEEEAARQVAQARAAQGSSSVPSAKAEGNKGMLMKVGIGVAVLLLLIGAYFIFGRKKEAPPAPEPPKVESKVETKTETKAETEKPMDPAVKAEKLKAYGQAMKAVNTQKRQDATSNEKIVFLVYDVQRRGTDLVVYGHFYNGKKNRTITAVKALELDIVLRDMDKELLNEKNIKYDQSFTGMSIPPLKDSQVIKITLPGKAPAVDFNNYTATAHDVHWEAVGN